MTEVVEKPRHSCSNCHPCMACGELPDSCDCRDDGTGETPATRVDQNDPDEDAWTDWGGEAG